MTTPDLKAADLHRLHNAINWAIAAAKGRDGHKGCHELAHADLLDECERRFKVVVTVTAWADVQQRIWWAASAHDSSAGLRRLVETRDPIPTRRLAELRALALALKEMGVLA